MSKQPEVIKMHNFRIVQAESWKKGSMQKKGKIFRIMDVDNWVYECGKCQTKFQIDTHMPLADVNREITLRLPCL